MIKKRLILCLCLALMIVLPCLEVSAAPMAELRGPSDVRPGDTVTLTYAVNGSGLLGADCEIDYPSQYLTLVKVEKAIGDPWMLEFNEPKVLAWDNAQTKPIYGDTPLFTAVFRLNDEAVAGTKLTVGVINTVLSDGDVDKAPEDAFWTVTVGQKRSQDASLSLLSASNATLSPAFSPSIAQYSATVPYSVRSLDLTVVPNHSGATYKISGNTLKVGENTISVKITAEDQSTRTYRIVVTRQQDPGYLPSSDATLQSLTPSVGTLSPAFDPAVNQYAIYLPYEATSLTLHGVPNDKNATAADLTTELDCGLNTILYRITAEDGQIRNIVVHAVRMPQFEQGTLPILPPSQTDDGAQEDPSTDQSTNAPVTEPSTEPIGEEKSSFPTSLLAFLMGIVGICVGFGAAILWNRQRKQE